jgi:ubiquinone/menaquinone biosynthesis C-methylase UbiE
MWEIIDSFNKAAATYDEWYRTPLGEYALRAELNGLNALLPGKGQGAEVGAGTGIFAQYLKTAHRTILCVDPAIEMQKKAQERGLQSVLGTAEAPPMKPRSLDFIYLVLALEFLHEPVKALASLRPLLKPRSSMTVVTINKESAWGTAYSRAGRQGDPIFRNATFYTLQDAVGFLEQSGYRFDTALGTLFHPPNAIPASRPRLISRPTQKTKAGVFLIRGIESE